MAMKWRKTGEWRENYELFDDTGRITGTVSLLRNNTWAANIENPHTVYLGRYLTSDKAKLAVESSQLPVSKVEIVGLCDTTMTPRVAPHWCVCLKRTDEMGPCLTWEKGSNGRCVLCDHEFYCHSMLMAAQGKPLAQEVVEAKNETTGPIQQVTTGATLVELSKPEVQDWYEPVVQDDFPF